MQGAGLADFPPWLHTRSPYLLIAGIPERVTEDGDRRMGRLQYPAVPFVEGHRSADGTKRSVEITVLRDRALPRVEARPVERRNRHVAKRGVEVDAPGVV